MSNHFVFYILCLVGIIVGIAIVKKVASCLVKLVLLAVIVGLLALYWFCQ
mgnify:CR=1 FL=1